MPPYIIRARDTFVLVERTSETDRRGKEEEGGEKKKKKNGWKSCKKLITDCFVEQTTNALRFFLRFHARSRNETFITRRGDTPRSFVVEIFKRTVFFFFFFFSLK